MFRKKIPLRFFIVTILILLAVSNLVTYFFLNKNYQEKLASSNIASFVKSNCDWKEERLSGFKFTRPLVFAEARCESSGLASIKTSVNNIINNYKSQQIISSASVYFEEFGSDQWFEINGDEKYGLGSLSKVPLMIAYFKMNENQPGLLDKKLTFNHEYNLNKAVHFKSKSIQPGKSYTVKELINYMIVYSDNNATMMLYENADMSIFKKVFTDIGLKFPDSNAAEYILTPVEYSMFMRELINAGYLSIKDSEYCIEVLSRSDFDQGMAASIPEGMKIAHKFGEGGTDVNPVFSESGIVYFYDRPYILTVMSKGADIKKLPLVITDISKVVFDNFAHLSNL